MILDWGDSFLGHPLIDELAFTERSRRRAGSGPRVVRRRLGRIVPGADPARAARLLEPMVSLLAAVMYANFCRDIEPDERIYHASDALRMLRQAATPRTDSRLPGQVGYPLRAVACLSGLKSTPRKRVKGNLPRVQIPPPPPF